MFAHWTHRRIWLLLASTTLIAGCGARSEMGLDDLEDAGTEGGTDAPFDTISDVVYDHVNDINGCNPATCGGCCDKTGTCRTGLETSACGMGGYECVDCGAFNASCNSATHTCGASTPCNASTCPNGCCTAAGVCVDGSSNAACGTSGQACATCPSGTNCDPSWHTCVGSQDCGPWNCGGCCDLWGNCNWGGDTWACGMGGGFCQDCGSQGLSCDPNSYTCTSTQDCGPWNCPGCCDWYGYCNWGGDDWACGWGGNLCSDCWSMGMSCNPDQGACMTQQDCGPWNCDGCCDWNGQCQWGGEDWACGAKGQMCEDCGWYGGSCDPNMKMCSIPEPCGPANCPGCCDPYSNECRMGFDSWACGTSGQVCQDCNGPGMQCTATPAGGGLCVSTNPTCGPNNCKGCCDCSSTGGCVCLPGFEPYACGNSGQICQDCAYGSVCDPAGGGGQCVAQPPEDCGFWNCAGCCTSTFPSYCVEGLDPWQCGYGGQICESCYPGQTCEWLASGGGTCGGYIPDGGPPDCGPWNCPGCCLPGYPPTCLSGYEWSACGYGGETCTQCGYNQTCDPTPMGGGVCSPTPVPDGGLPDGGACGPWNCNGCCTAAGQCRPGLSDMRCGKGGEMCENCTVQNLVCVDGDCSP